jgi:signal transduction histidine kinase
MGAQLDSGVQASQRIVRSLRPAVLDFGVIGAAEWLASDFAKRTGIPCSFSTSVEELPLAPELGTAVFRVMQESLTNILRHAGANEVSVRFGTADGEVRLEVSDNGRGIGPEDLSKRSSFGVRGMRERVLDLGGTLDIAPAPDGGTRLSLRLPLLLATEQGEA